MRLAEEHQHAEGYKRGQQRVVMAAIFDTANKIRSQTTKTRWKSGSAQQVLHGDKITVAFLYAAQSVNIGPRGSISEIGEVNPDASITTRITDGNHGNMSKAITTVLWHPK